MNTNYCAVCGKEITAYETFFCDGLCENCFKNIEEDDTIMSNNEIINKIRELSEEWVQESNYCTSMYNEDKNNGYDIRAEVWGTASDYLLNLAADLEMKFQENN